MCGIPYNSLALVFEDEPVKLPSIGPIRIHPNQKSSDSQSTASSHDLSWLDPLKPNGSPSARANYVLPKLSDFKYYLQLGDGYFTKVYCVQHIPSKEYVAIKIASGTDPEAKLQMDIEKYVLFKYSHLNPFMIKPYCSFNHGVR